MDIDQRDEKTQIMYRIKREGKKKRTGPPYGLLRTFAFTFLEGRVLERIKDRLETLIT